MPHFKLLIFDLDGTLVDSKDDIIDAVNMTLDELSVKAPPYEEICSYIGSGVRALLRDVLGGETPLHAESLVRFKKHYMEGLLNKTVCYNGVTETLSFFNNKKKAIATNKPWEYTDKIVAGLGLCKMVDMVQGSSDEMPLKPDPCMLNIIMDRFGVSKSDTLMIGDGANDILAARAASIRVCAVGYGIGDSRLLLNMNPDFFVDNILELQHLIT